MTIRSFLKDIRVICGRKNRRRQKISFLGSARDDKENCLVRLKCFLTQVRMIIRRTSNEKLRKLKQK